MKRREVIKCLKREINKRNSVVKIKNADIFVQKDIPEQISKIEEWELIGAIEQELGRQFKVFDGMHHWSYKGSTWEDFKNKGLGNIEKVRVQWHEVRDSRVKPNLEIFFNKSEDSITDAIRRHRNAGGIVLTHNKNHVVF